MSRLKAEDLPPATRDQIARSWQGASATGKGPKFKAKETWVDNIRFPSKLQAAHYGLLKMMRDARAITYFLREVSFDLPGGVKHRVDWMVVRPPWEIIFADSKGFDTPMGRLKRKQVEALYGIKIRIWSDPGKIIIDSGNASLQHGKAL